MLDELKYHLKITWNEEDEELARLLGRGKLALKRIFGVEIDYEENEDLKDLLFNWCRYSRNNATEFFQENFREEINTAAFTLAIKDKKNSGDNNG